MEELLEDGLIPQHQLSERRLIVAHLTGVERGWLREHFAGEPKDRVRDREFEPSDRL